MDTQGHEGHILAGARLLIESAIPVVVEYWPYGLRRSNGLHLLEQAIVGGFAHFVDLRSEELELVPVSRIPEWQARYEGVEHTDLLLLHI
jgi:hypothetical protein